MKLKRLSSEEFDRLAATTRLREQARNMARSVLVDGRTQVDVATEWGMSKQRVNLAVAAIERAYSASTAPGGGMVRVSLDLPEGLALELSNLMEATKECQDKELVAAAVEKIIVGIRSAARRFR